MKVFFDAQAEELISQYYEEYEYLPTGGTDLRQRADNYSKIVQVLSKIKLYLDQTYVKDNRNFIDVGNIATIEYEIANDESLIVVKNIYFNNNLNSILY